MKHSYVGNTALQKLAERASPAVRVYVETVITDGEDTKDTYTEFVAADSLTGLTPLASGGVTLTGATSPAVVYSIGSDDVVTTLDGIDGDPAGCVYVEWNNATDEEQEIREFVAYLDPNTGGGKQVTTWLGQLFRVHRVTKPEDTDEAWELQPLTARIPVTAGVSLANVTFAVNKYGKINVGPAPLFDGENTEGDSILTGNPVTVLAVWALKADGQIASNVAWVGNAAVNTGTSSGNSLSRVNFVPIDDTRESQRMTTLGVDGITGGLPRFSVRIASSYSAQTITWSTTSGTPNIVDLGSVPTDRVEFIVEGEEPQGSSITGQVLNDSTSATWVTFTDGASSTALSSVNKKQKYKVRATLTPSGAGEVAPTLRRIGVRAITREVPGNQIIVGNPRYTVDPRTLKASIPQLSVNVLRDGNRDYRDWGTERFSDNHIGKLALRVWYGSTGLARANHIHLDDFLVHNIESGGETLQIDAVHPMAYLRRGLPVPSTSGTREAVVYGSTETPITVYDDLLDRSGIAGRYRGQGIVASTGVDVITGSTLNISNTLKDQRPTLDELDRVAFIVGGSVTPSQGRIRFTRFYDGDGVLQAGPVPGGVFESAEIIPVSVTPNFHQRIVEYRAPFGWDPRLDDGNGAFEGTVWTQSTAGVTKLGRAINTVTDELGADVARWLPNDSTTPSPTSTLATNIAKRTVASLKSGMVTVSFESASYPRPWLEPGDVVAVRTDRFVGRTLETDKALRGQLWAIGPLIETDLHGKTFTVWVQDLDTHLPTTLTASNRKYKTPVILQGVLGYATSGFLESDFTFNKDAAGLKVSGGTTGYPTAATVRGSSTVFAVDSDLSYSWGSTTFVQIDSKGYLSALAYETSTGGGAESTLFKASLRRPASAIASSSVPIAPTTAGITSSTSPVSATLTYQDAANNETSFWVYRQTTATPGFVLQSTTSVALAGTTSQASYTDTAVTTGLTYDYRVYARNLAGNSTGFASYQVTIGLA